MKLNVVHGIILNKDEYIADLKRKRDVLIAYQNEIYNQIDRFKELINDIETMIGLISEQIKDVDNLGEMNGN